MSAAYRAKVRMYRHGLGDCFLITLPRDGDAAPYRIMIDCGVVEGTDDAAGTMQRVVDDIIETTKGTDGRGKVDLVIATHAHWDHVSGFVQARDALAKIDFGEVWLAWTENPNDVQAKRLAAQRGTVLTTLRVGGSRLRLAGRDEAADHVDSFVTSFFGVGSGSSPAAAMDVVRGLVPGKPPRYCAPGDAPVQPSGTNAWLYVLGPPRDENLQKKAAVAATGPSAFGVDQIFGVAGMGIDLAHLTPALESTDPDAPFDPMQTIPTAIAAQLPFFAQRYWGSDTDPSGDGPEWRRIDSAFLDAASQLTLQLDNATNNTSLVLAIELEGGDVLLFPGDAQIGNWLSWQNLEWNVAETKHTGAQLLSRVIFYKAGHHGTHNATLNTHGLELMDRLKVAMIPVDEAMARSKNWSRMPDSELVGTLKEKTHDAVIQADKPLPPGITSVETAPDKRWYEVTL